MRYRFRISRTEENDSPHLRYLVEFQVCLFILFNIKFWDNFWYQGFGRYGSSVKECENEIEKFKKDYPKIKYELKITYNI